ncbi:hypothetical protein F2Q70_00004080 [Brassica cretica]|uniref:Uncharacterized protein n=1 Tax=Brassica cretica TaxID=69181 RepID=A0A8S9IMK1_BRACR|nr:hypothetical protein F2Q70_00004080 [Brassica cretica]
MLTVSSRQKWTSLMNRIESNNRPRDVRNGSEVFVSCSAISDDLDDSSSNSIIFYGLRLPKAHVFDRGPLRYLHYNTRSSKEKVHLEFSNQELIELEYMIRKQKSTTSIKGTQGSLDTAHETSSFDTPTTSLYTILRQT